MILGEFDTRKETDCLYQKYGEDCADPPQEFNAYDYVMHPDYNSRLMINDIAIIRLDRKAIFSGSTLNEIVVLVISLEL